MPDPTGRISHLPDMHRGTPWKTWVHAASASNVPVTYLQPGVELDGVTLQTEYRVLLKDQTSAASNGIYEIVSAPSNFRRAYDMDQDASSSVPAEEVLGAVVKVVAGSSNSQTFWHTTNTATGSLGTDSINFRQLVFGGGGSSTVYSKRDHGGEDLIKVHGATGSTETIDAADGNVHTLTLDADCTFTLTAPTASVAVTIELYVTGSGTHTWTWPASVVWAGGTAPSAPADASLKRIILETLDGGTTWYGVAVGTGSTTTTTTTTSAEHVHAIGEQHVADGSSSTYTLGNAAEPDTLAAYQDGIRTDVTLTGTNDTVTFPGVPPIGAALRFDYIVEQT